MYDLNTILGNYTFGVDFGASAYKFVLFIFALIVLLLATIYYFKTAK